MMVEFRGARDDNRPGDRITVRPEAIVAVVESQIPTETYVMVPGMSFKVVGAYDDVMEQINHAVLGY